jgi:Notch-like protein
MGAKQIGKMSELENGAPLHHILQNCSYSYPKIKFRYTSTEEIEKIIKSLKTKNAHGCDEISIETPKCSAPFVCSPPTYIFNKSFDLGSFPSRLKYPKVITFFKTGDRLNMSKFRPISVLISFFKIFDKIIYKRIYAHVVLNKILTNEQNGFRSSLSTVNASYTLIYEFLSAANNKHTVGGLFVT